MDLMRLPSTEIRNFVQRGVQYAPKCRVDVIRCDFDPVTACVVLHYLWHALSYLFAGAKHHPLTVVCSGSVPQNAATV